MIEMLWANRLRMAVETSVGSGVAADGWIVPPCTGAGATRVLENVAERLDAFRQPRDRRILQESWILRTGHELGLDFFRWLMLPHLTQRTATHYTLDPEAEGPTFTLDGETQDGHRVKFYGMKLAELQIFFDEGRAVAFECTWVALLRGRPVAALPDGAEIVSRVLATYQCRVNWHQQISPPIVEGLPTHAGQLFFTRETAPVNFGPDGLPSGHTSRPWRVLAEIYLPEHPGMTDAAMDGQWSGALEFEWGNTGDRIFIENGQGVITDENLKDFDFRTHRIALEAFTDTRRGLIELVAPL